MLQPWASPSLHHVLALSLQVGHLDAATMGFSLSARTRTPAESVLGRVGIRCTDAA
jgi:hypothetical protein